MRPICILCAFTAAVMAQSLGCAKPAHPRMLYATSPPPAETAAESAVRTWNFEDTTTGKLPARWHAAETKSAGKLATWAVVADPAAPSKPNVLAITHTANTGGTFNLLIAAGTAFKDLDLSVKIRAETGVEDQGGGLIWRCQDANNYYVCRWNPLETNCRLYQVIGGNRTQIASTDTSADRKEWHTLRVVMKGSHIECYLDAQKLLEGDDESLSAAGAVGLWSKADAASSFDDLTVQDLP